MTDLIEFLNARLGEDEAAAKAATPGPWAFERDDPTDDELFTTYEGTVDLVGVTVAYTRHRQVANGQHMARNDPARTLREVEALRAVLAEHYILTSDDRNPDYDEFSVVPWGAKGGSGDQGSGCATCHYYGMGGVKGYGTCRTVRLLAAIYSDHPDYRQEWKS